MADERLVTVKSSGGDYTSLAAAIAGEAGDLVAADEWLHIECYAMSDTTQTTISGFTTSSDCHILVEAPVSERHSGVWDTNKYRITCLTYLGTVRVVQSHVKVEGLQVTCDLGWGGNGMIIEDDLENVQFSKCICKDIVSFGFFSIKGVEPYYQMYNCLAINIGEAGFGIRGTYAYNCTSTACVHGFKQMWISVIAYNCLSFNNSDSDFGSAVTPANLTLYNCASGDSSATSYAGSNNRANQTFTFKDAAHGDYHLAEGDTGARGYGAVNPGSGLYLDDVDGELRGASWDIGFDQYVSSGPEPEGKMQKWYYHTQTMRG